VVIFLSMQIYNQKKDNALYETGIYEVFSKKNKKSDM